MDDERSQFPVVIRFRASKELKAQLKILARRRQQKMSDMLRQLALGIVEREEKERGPLIPGAPISSEASRLAADLRRQRKVERGAKAHGIPREKGTRLSVPRAEGDRPL